MGGKVAKKRMTPKASASGGADLTLMERVQGEGEETGSKELGGPPFEPAAPRKKSSRPRVPLNFIGASS